jgi:hypothetical protein
MRTWLLVIGLLLAACEPTATPFPVDIPSPMRATDLVPVRYGLAADLVAAAPADWLADVQPTPIGPDWTPDDLGTLFDVIVGYATLPQATPAPAQVHLSLAINPALPPLDDSDLMAFIRRGLDGSALSASLNIPGSQPAIVASLSAAQIRSELANRGQPDGFEVNIAAQTRLGLEGLIQQLADINVRANLIAETDFAHLILFLRTIPDGASGTNGETSTVLDLLVVPVNTVTVSNLEIMYTADGWPLAKRP